MNYFRLISRNVLGRPARNILTALGIAIGVCAFVSLVALANSFVRTMDAMFTSRGTDLGLVRPNSPDILMSSLPEALGKKLKEQPEVTQVAPILAQMLWAENQPATLIMGMPAGSFLLEHMALEAGRGIQEQDEDAVFLGQTLAARLKKKPGDWYEIESHSFEVVGIYDAGNTLENSGAVVPMKRLQWLLNREGEVTVFNMRIQKGLDSEKVGALLKERLKNVEPVITAKISEQHSGLAMVQTMSLATSAIALCMGLVGTLNSMLMTVLERTREMGLLRAIGWRRSRILALVLGESLVLSFVGGVLGLILGALALHLVLSHPKINGLLTAGLTPGLSLQALGLALALGLLGGLLPALRGSKLEPTEALRHE